jgi:protein CpxP
MAAKIADRADATEEQEQDIKLIVEGMMTELAPMRAEREDFRAEVKSALMRDTVDQAELETLRARALDRADDASVVVTAALGNVASVLTPDQRVDLADDLEKMRDRLQR